MKLYKLTVNLYGYLDDSRPKVDGEYNGSLTPVYPSSFEWRIESEPCEKDSCQDIGQVYNQGSSLVVWCERNRPAVKAALSALKLRVASWLVDNQRWLMQDFEARVQKPEWYMEDSKED